MACAVTQPHESRQVPAGCRWPDMQACIFAELHEMREVQEPQAQTSVAFKA